MNEERTFTITFAKGHPTITVDGNVYVVDLGSPLSFSRTGSIELCGSTFPTCDKQNTQDIVASVFSQPTGENGNSMFGGLLETASAFADKLGINFGQIMASHYSVDTFEKMLGTPIDGLIGGDIMSQFAGVEFNYQNNVITFYESLPAVADRVAVGMSVKMGYTMIDINIDGRNQRMILDSGAPTAYLKAELLPNREPDGESVDVSPNGEFNSPVFNMATEFAGKTFTVAYGKLPMKYKLGMIPLNCVGVLGTDIFNQGAAIVSYQNAKLYLRNFNN